MLKSRLTPLYTKQGHSDEPKQGIIQEVFHVYLNKFEIELTHLFFIIFSNNKFTLVNQISRNAHSPKNSS